MLEKVNKWLTLVNSVAIVVIALVLVGGSSDPTGGTRFPSGLSADSTAPSSGEVRGTTLTVTGATTLSGAITSSGGITSTGGDFSVDTNDFFVDISADAVGIGTSTPQDELHVEEAPAGDGTIASSTIIVGQVGTTTSRSQLQLKQDDGGVSCAWVNSAGTAFIVEDGACNQ